MAAFEEDTFERLWGGVAARASCSVFEDGYVVSYFKRSVNSFEEEGLYRAADIVVSASFPHGAVRDGVFVYCFY